MSIHNVITAVILISILIHPRDSTSAPPPPLDYPCKPPIPNSHQFCNTSLSVSDRARSLVSLLNLDEKIHHLCNNVTPIQRLNLPAYEWWSESLHGIASNGPGISFNGSVKAATSFPQVIVQAAAFNRSLWFETAAAIAVEARAMYNLGQAGLTYWAPNVNVFRDPRWGRGQETPGEDPMLTSAYAVEYVKGFQGGKVGKVRKMLRNEFKILRDGDEEEEDESLMLSACCKHLTAYDLESWGNFSRYTFNAVVSKQDLEDTYQPPFKSCVQQGKASCVMCSYNSVNGIPACASGELIEKVRTDWGFNGYITSDCDAVATVYEYQHYVGSPEDAVSDVLKAGVDINCGTYMLLNTKSAVEQGKAQEEDIDRALFNLFSVLLRLGLYDGDPAKGKYGMLGSQDVCTAEHKKLALEAAQQGIVLLKNDKRFLPLDKNSVSSLAVVGPMANDSTILGGGYTGIPCNPESLLEGFQAYVGRTTYATGCSNVSCLSDEQFDEAIHVSEEADYVVVVLGLDLSQETEDHDRVSLLLPGKQMTLVSAVAEASKKPLILVLTGGGPLDVSFAQHDPRIASILWIGYPGEAGPKALAQIIFGHHNPGGRLPMTWYPESYTSIAMNDMSMRADPSRGFPGRTYRFYTGDRVYGFGGGLSYSTYTYKLLSTPDKISLTKFIKANPSVRLLDRSIHDSNFIQVDRILSCAALKFYVHISVTNVGDMDGSHVVMLFARLPKHVDGTPERQLVGFSRVHTTSQGTTETSILLDPCEHLSTANEQGIKILPLGNHVLMVDDIEHPIAILV